jgi:hypothetical protein
MVHPPEIELGLWRPYYGGDGDGAFIHETARLNPRLPRVFHRRPHYVSRPDPDDTLVTAWQKAQVIIDTGWNV